MLSVNYTLVFLFLSSAGACVLSAMVSRLNGLKCVRHGVMIFCVKIFSPERLHLYTYTGGPSQLYVSPVIPAASVFFAMVQIVSAPLDVYLSLPAHFPVTQFQLSSIVCSLK